MLTQILIPSLHHQLTALRSWLDKVAPGTDETALLTSRLAPDMFPLYGQLRFVSFLAREPIHRLRGEDTPAEVVALRTHGASGSDEPGSLAEHRASLDDTLAFLGGVGESEFDDAADRPLAHALPMGMIFDLTGLTYVRDWALPQVYFHCDMAYALLRAAGLPLGKRDYVPHMFAYLRPGTMPGAAGEGASA